MPLIFALQQAPPLASGIVAAVSQFTDFLLGYVAALAAVGALSMALIEAGKKLLDSRTKFHALRWTRWMIRSAGNETQLPPSDARDALRGSSRPYNRALALTELLQLTTGVPRDEGTRAAERLLAAGGHLSLLNAFSPAPEHALFALDLARMMGSIEDAADIALASPRQYPGLYLFMTTGADYDDVSRWLSEGATLGLTDDDAEPPTAQQRQTIKERAERFARLRQIVKRKLDGFQLYTGDRWASWNQFAANALGIVVMFGILVWLRRTSTIATPNTVSIVVFSLFGGILSPVAKDIISALKRVKDG